ncbi:YwmB family TATA-box binding protein [Mesobacillus maritimus]|uniref:YwmB family TATA-box binding protein n=1 Tax=Mesobacillus maritimus TaxID=1643336 RepID=UPI00203D36A1|nr:YwmB family TATA-box binding protein [Mesobacillus maritimus]MCM3586895.1 YwmB family TATA-box binding protein [Mesobacillus maritimus]
MKKWSFYLSIIGIIGFIMFQVGNKTIVANESNQDLTKLVSVLEDEHILINEWSLYSREMMESQKVDHYVTQLKDKFSDWSWSHSVEENQETITGTSISSDYIEEIKIVAHGPMQTYVMYEVKGKNWSTHAEDFIAKSWPEQVRTIFHAEPQTFSCIKGEFGDKIDEALPVYMSGLLEAFDAEEIEALEEENFVSTSAYSPLFTETISEDHEMNLQLGLRKPDGMGGNTTLVVGTPIITIEY